MTITATAPVVGIERTKMNAIVFASCIGTIIEWYDFLIYATAATLVFNKAFFPTFDPLAGTLAALGSYAVGFLARPLGRRAVRSFRRSAGPQIHAGADAVYHGSQHILHRPAADLCLDRRIRADPADPAALVQGIGLGGEWGGASLMVLEHAPADKRGFYTSFVQIGFPIGLVLATWCSRWSQNCPRPISQPMAGVFRSWSASCCWGSAFSYDRAYRRRPVFEGAQGARWPVQRSRRRSGCARTPRHS